MHFFLDENISYRIANALDDLSSLDGDKVEHILERYRQGVQDTVWLTDLATNNPSNVVILTTDSLNKNKAETQARIQSGITVFMLKNWKSQSYWDIAYRLVKYFPEIKKQAQTGKPKVAYSVSINGKIEIYNKK